MLFSFFVVPFLLVIASLSFSKRHKSFVQTLGGNSTTHDEGFSIIQASDDSFFMTGYIHRIEGGEKELLFAKFDTDGYLKFSKTILGGISPQIWELTGYSVIETILGNFVLTGFTDKNTGNGHDMLLAKFNTQGEIKWFKTLSSPASEDEKGFSIAETPDGGFIICGDYYSLPRQEQLLVKISKDGELLFAKTLGGSFYESGKSIQVTSDGSFISCGYTRMGALMPHQSVEILVAKHDCNGSLLWSISFGNTNQDECKSIIETSDGGFVLTGEQFWDVGGTYSYDVVITKLNSSGNILWIKSLGSVGVNRGKSIIETTDGNYVLSGDSQMSSGEPTTPLLAKFSVDGDLIWARVMNSSIGKEGSGESVKETKGGGFIICGDIAKIHSPSDMDIMVSLVEKDGKGCDWVEWNDSVVTDLKSQINWFDCTAISTSLDLSSSLNLTTPSSYFVYDDYVKNSFVCKSCNDSYFGEYCNITTCFGKWNNETSTTTDICSGNGICSYLDQCSCTQGFIGSECEQLLYCHQIPANSSKVCSTHGDCIETNKCQCKENYYGEYCNITTCNYQWSNDTSACSYPYGKCVDFERCVCSDNYFGEYCNITTCFGILSNDTSRTCLGHGDCFLHDTCKCDPNYFEYDCNVTTCFGIFSNITTTVCNGHGNCNSYDDCTCIDSYLSPHIGTGDKNCTDWKCFGEWKDSVGVVCNGHGSCNSPETCLCESSLYNESDCGQWYCYGVSRKYIEVCGGKGHCFTSDSCTCDPGGVDGGYFGKECTMFNCFGYQKNSSEVCSGHGYCEHADHCNCNIDYTTTIHACDTWYCGGIRKDEVKTCSGNGVCLAPNICDCSSNFKGSTCSECNDGYESYPNCKKKGDNNKYLTYAYIAAAAFGVIILGICIIICLCVSCICLFCCFLVCSGCVSSISLPSFGGAGFSGLKKIQGDKKNYRFSKLKDIKFEVLEEEEYEKGKSSQPYKKMK